MKPLRPNRFLALLTVTSALSGSAFALNYQWDVNSNAAGLGGAGAWDTTSSFWDLTGTGLDDGTDTPAPYTFTNADIAIFGGTAGTVTLGTGVTLNGIRIDTAAYVITGNTLTLSGTTPTITANANGLISSALAGSAGLIKAGTGSITISGANSFTGGTTVNAGTLTLSRSAGFGGTSGSISSGDLTINTGAVVTTTTSFAISGDTGATNARIVNISGGTLTLGLGEYIKTYNLTGGILNAPTVANEYLRASAAGLNINSLASATTSTVNNKVDLTFASGAMDVADGAAATDLNIAGVISQNTGAGTGAKTITKLGAGNLVFSGTTSNTYTGLTTVSAGTLTLDKNDGVIAVAGNILVNGTGRLVATVNKSGRIADTANVTIDGATAAFSFGANQNDTINVLAVNNGGTVTIGNASSNLRPNGGITSTGGGSITQITGAAGLNFNGAVRTVTVADSNLTIGATIANGGLTKAGSGILTLSGASTYTGATSINAGTLVLGATGTITTTPSIVVNSGTTFDVSSATFILGSSQTLSGNGTVNGPVTVSTTGGTLAAVGGNFTLTSLAFNGAGTINALPGTGYLDVTATNGTNLLGGAASVTVNVGTNSLPAGTYHILKYSGSLQGAALSGFVLGITPGGGFGYELIDNAGFVDLKVTALAAMWTGAASSEWSTAEIASPKNWSKNSLPVDYLTGDDTLFNDAATGTTVDISVADVSPTTVTFQNSTSNYILQGSKGITGSTGLLKAGSGSLKITNTSDFSGDVTLNGGTLEIASIQDGGNPGPLGTGFNINLSGGTLLYTGSSAGTDRGIVLSLANAINVSDAGATLSLNYAVSGTGGFEKSGPGSLLLNASSNYTGTTTLSGGSIQLGANTALGTTAGGTTVATGTFLDLNGKSVGAEPLVLNGSGPSGGGVLVNTSGTPAVLNGPISLASAVVIGGSGDISLGGAISGSDLLTKTGSSTLTLGGASTYTGNIAVNAGTLKLGTFGNGGTPITTGALGAENKSVTKVVVASGAAVDFNGFVDNVYGYTISGTGIGGTGALINTGAAIGTGNKQTSNIRLADDATIGGSANWALLTAGFGATTLDLNGKTLTKTGSNAITLVNSTVTAGALNVASGTLSLMSGTAISDSAVVKIATGATLNLGVTATDTIDSLYIDGVQQATGIYKPVGVTGAGTELAALTGTGKLQVTTGPLNTFAAWMAGFTFAPDADTTPTGDADGDGISNLIENVFGTAPNMSTPGITQVSGSTPGTLVFKHPVNSSLASNVTYTYTWSTDLSEWKASGETNTGGTSVSINAVTTGSEATVTASVTPSTAEKAFVRIQASVAP